MELEIVTDENDPVGKAVAGRIKTKVLSDALHLESFETGADAIIIPYRHRSEKGIPCFTVHSTGNFGKALLGGKDEELAFSHPLVAGNLLRILDKLKLEGFDVAYEATHHGPTSLKKPVVFLELGSTEKEWHNEKAVNVLVKALEEIEKTKLEGVSCLGVGGTHYPQKFTKRTLQEDLCFGHMISKYTFPDIKDELILQAIRKTVGLKKVIIDKKSLNAEYRDRIIGLCEKEKVETVKI